jgi:hypothetical protein
VQAGRLAMAVSQTGALGSLPCALLPRQSLSTLRPGRDDPLRGDGKVWPRRCKGTVRGSAR